MERYTKFTFELQNLQNVIILLLATLQLQKQKLSYWNLININGFIDYEIDGENTSIKDPLSYNAHDFSWIATLSKICIRSNN